MTGGKHECVVVSQFDDCREHLIRPPPRSNGTVDESSEFQMERVLASEEAIRIVAWHIRRVYFRPSDELEPLEEARQYIGGHGR
ncbi:hypothetical protein [Rhizobium leguminosarum]|uniref:hypothetical protein n=1 Tax=Rhizobium leguminosarum TaxID=384 RepID=UPI001C9285FD|nr:hypothetical protein [Rhizobium leguminosarum]MBY2916972.1 hypothetical protein [Rhizobium leguminosarum]MBY2926341.1 hypothetical protein [Rhizobium leguminosarum]MBY2972209.1 hypothetical protein [Rhizobium leguminosarum]MBY2979610.1 hypothetical protein [Rhizobium leguminosarum]MBY3008161.1 hypothetical protein [Rhizobium leguminosarum]